MNSQDGMSRLGGASQKQTEVAVLAGGCFWGVEEILRDVPGVVDTEVGYTGGWLENPTYADTHHSKSGHAEAIRVTFDPAVLTTKTYLRSGSSSYTTQPRSIVKVTTPARNIDRRFFRRRLSRK